MNPTTQESRRATPGWYFMRLSGLLLLALAGFHLFYQHFGAPGGVAQITYASVVARWTDPAGGVLWRTFDMALLLLGLTHGAVGAFKALGQRAALKALLGIGYLALVGLGATIIFSV